MRLRAALTLTAPLLFGACPRQASREATAKAESSQARHGPQVPPPMPVTGWLLLGGDARLRRDGLAMILTADRGWAMALDTRDTLPASPMLVRAQIWKISGRPTAHVSLVIGKPHTVFPFEGCVLELAPDGNVRLTSSYWSEGRQTGGTSGWSQLQGLSPERTTPDVATGALIIREIAAELSTDSMGVSVDSRPALAVPVPAACRSGFAGVYADSGVTLRLAYLTAGPSERR